MPTHAGDRVGLGGAAKLVADKLSSIVRLELQLAGEELKQKVSVLGLGIALVVGGALFAVFGLGFTFATIAAALATVVSTWLALLIVAGGLFLLAGLLVLLGVGRLQKATPPLPEQAIVEAKLTAEAVRNGRR
jgi:Putative Actinobacterial Holin-X, holin superfamily III